MSRISSSGSSSTSCEEETATLRGDFGPRMAISQGNFFLCVGHRKMGAASSSSLCDHRSTETQFNDLPESCVAMVLSHLSPMEIAALARVNSVFYSASTADFTWVPKLPSNFMYIIDKIQIQNQEDDLNNKHKMNIYATLCRPCPFDGGTKAVWIDKETGGVFLAISSKAMTITGIDDRRYWNRIPANDTRFETVAYLKQIWWVEVSGTLEFQLPPETYSLYFRLQLGRACKRRHGGSNTDSDDIHGWDVKPAKFQLKTHDGQTKITHSKINNVGKWSYYHVGDFVVNNRDSDSVTRVDFSLAQIDCTHIKKGLCVDCVLVCPRGLRPEETPSL